MNRRYTYTSSPAAIRDMRIRECDYRIIAAREEIKEAIRLRAYWKAQPRQRG